MLSKQQIQRTSLTMDDLSPWRLIGLFSSFYQLIHLTSLSDDIASRNDQGRLIFRDTRNTEGTTNLKEDCRRRIMCAGSV